MRRILVPTDFSEPSRLAVRYAIALTHALGGEMLLLHVVEGELIRGYAVGELPDPPSSWIHALRPRLPRSHPQRLIYRDLYDEAQWKHAAWLPQGGAPRCRSLVVAGKVVEEIVRTASEQKVDHIIIGAQRRRGVRHLFSRGVADRVIRQAHVPVVIVWFPAQALAAGQALIRHMWRETHREQQAKRGQPGQKSRSTRRAPVATSAP